MNSKNKELVEHAKQESLKGLNDFVKYKSEYGFDKMFDCAVQATRTKLFVIALSSGSTEETANALAIIITAQNVLIAELLLELDAENKARTFAE